MELISAKCPNCGAEVELDEHMDQSICNYCNSKIYVKGAIGTTILCKYCGAKNYKDAEICVKCDKPVSGYKNMFYDLVKDSLNASKKTNVIIHNNAQVSIGKKCNKWIALMLCIFWGYFGAHKFYEKKGSLGVIYIFTLGLFGFGWIVDIFLILFKSNPYYAE